MADHKTATESEIPFKDRLSNAEARVFRNFHRLQESSDNRVMLLFHGPWGFKYTAATEKQLFLAGGLDGFVDKIIQDHPHLCKSLVMAMSLTRSFESQWPLRPGTLHSLNCFIKAPLVTVPGLPSSPHHRLSLVHNSAAANKNISQMMYPPRQAPQLKVIKGGLHLN